MKKYWVILFKVLFVALVIFYDIKSGNSEVLNAKVISVTGTNQNSLILEIVPQNWQQKLLQINNTNYVLIDLKEAVKIADAGKPQIPYLTTIVGIPLGASVKYDILDTEYAVENNIKLVPFPQRRFKEGISEYEYNPDEKIYAAQNGFPGEIIKIEPSTFFRDQEIVQIFVAAVQYFPSENQIRKLKRLRVQVTFANGELNSGGPIAYTTVAEEHVYRSSIVNYRQAMSWRKRARPVQSSLRKSNFLQNSTLYKFKIREEGIYKIDGRFLEANINNLNLATVDPAQIQIINNGGQELPRSLSASRPGGLVENALFVSDGGDGRFDRNDYILFYAKGVEGWRYDAGSAKFSHYINHYGFDNVYFLAIGGDSGKRMSAFDAGQTPDQVIDTYLGMAFIEEERTNPVASGMNWFGRELTTDPISSSQSAKIQLPNAISSETANFSLRFGADNAGTHFFDIILNNVEVNSTQFNGLDLAFGEYKRVATRRVEFTTTNTIIPGENSFKLEYRHSSTTGRAFLDWLEIVYPAQLSAVSNELIFTVQPASGQQTYRVSNFSSSDIQLFDVTDFSNVRTASGISLANGNLTFTDTHENNQPKRYVALSASRFKSIESLEKIEFTNLRDANNAAEFLIITHNDFLSEAERLKSLRENASPTNRLQTRVVVIDDIYNNFSSGLVDATATRDFLKYAYENFSPKPLYVLLLGDGDFDYKNITSKADLNWLPPYQTDIFEEGGTVIETLASRTTDGWFTYVSELNDKSRVPIMDMAIGRITAQSIAEAKSVIDKIIAYEMSPDRGKWRNTITMVGDDELIINGQPNAGDTVHIDPQSETIADQYIPDHFDLKKIYLTEFPKVRSEATGGIIKPAAKEALVSQINSGTVVVNFIGHGNSTLWTHEHIFEKADNDRVQNANMPIFFVAATCDWALFDMPDAQSQAEELLVAENRGAIGILSSARLVFASENFEFSKKFYNRLFVTPDSTNRVGDAFLLARQQTTSGSKVNDEKYHIYGDPTLRLAAPDKQAFITSITPDSILALSTMKIEGEIRQGTNLLSGYNGTALLNVFDSEKAVKNFPEAGGVQDYLLPGNSIFRGTTPIANGRFTTQFIVPKDISYGGRLARISVYFWNDETDGAGYLDNIKVSSSSSELVDTKGPEIRILFKENENFTTGDIVNENVTMVVELADTLSGINIAGEIGHRLILTIDPDEETCLSQLNSFNNTSTIDITDLFRFNEGDHLRGQIEFPLQFPSEVEIGGKKVLCADLDGEQRHTLVVKAWDNANNSSSASVEVVVVHDEGLVLRDVMNYPNPFDNKTTFTFFSNQDADVKIKIYTVSGQLINTLEYPFARNGFNMVEWDGRDADGDVPANGVYLYKLIANAAGSSGTLRKEITGRLAIIR